MVEKFRKAFDENGDYVTLLTDIPKAFDCNYQTELQNRATHDGVTTRVTNSKILYFLIFQVSNSM